MAHPSRIRIRWVWWERLEPVVIRGCTVVLLVRVEVRPATHTAVRRVTELQVGKLGKCSVFRVTHLLAKEHGKLPDGHETHVGRA